MNKKFKVIIIGLILAGGSAFNGCSIERAPTRAEVSLGSVVVSAKDPYEHTLLGGQIYLDGVIQPGKLTPDTMQAEVGNHSVKVEFTNFYADSEVVTFIADTVTFDTLTLTPLNPDIGMIFVDAKDANTNAPLDSALIFLDGAQTPYFAPNTLQNIPVGYHNIGVRKANYYYVESSVDVVAGLITPIIQSIPTAPFNGIRIIASTPAQICIDDKLYDFSTPWLVSGIPEGTHTFCCYLDSFMTLTPLINAQLFSFGAQEFTFELAMSPDSTGHNVGQVGPGYTLINVDDDSVSLGAYRGRVVLMTFWMLSCVPCMNELPFIQDVYEELGPQGFRVLGINPADSKQIQINVRNDKGLSFELLRDQGYAVTMTYLLPPTYPFPTNILIDQRGVIYWYTGSLDTATLRAKVLELLDN